MPFLLLNNLRVSVIDGGELGFDDVGRVSRQATGALTADRRYVARRWRFSTAPMGLADYQALRGFCERTAVTWPVNGNNVSNLPSDRFSSAIQSDVAYVSGTAADGSVVVPGPKFGSHGLSQGLVGANLWPTNIATGTDAMANTTGFTPVLGGAIASSTARAWQGGRALRLIAASIGDGVRTVAYVGNTSQRWTATFFITGSGTYTARLWASGVLMGSISFVAPPSTWARVVVPRNAAVPTDASDVYLSITADQPGTCFLDGLMLEATTGEVALSYPWVDGNRAASTWLAQLAQTGQLGDTGGISVNFWTTKFFAPGCLLVSVTDATATLGLSFACATVAGSDVLYGGLTPSLIVTDGHGTTAGLAMPDAPTFPTVGAYKMFSLVVTPWPATGKPSLEIYVDGARVSASNPDLSRFDPTKLVRVLFGGGGGQRATGSVVDDLTIFPFVLGPATIASIFDSQAPMPASWPILTASGQAMGSAPVAVLATLDKAEYLAFFDRNGAFEPHGVTATLTLQEVAGDVVAALLGAD
jgi:hypothetical protein